MLDIVVRPLNQGDITEQYRSWFDDPDVQRYIEYSALPGARTIEGLSQYLNDISNDPCRWLIGIFIGKEHVGNIGVQFDPRNDGLCTIGFLIGSSANRGRGIVGHAFSKLIELLPQSIDVIYLGVEGDNLQAISAYRRMGFNVCLQSGSKLRMRYDIARCKICRSDKIEVLSLKNFPRSIWPSARTIPQDNLEYAFCGSCGYASSSLCDTVDLAELYSYEQFVVPTPTLTRDRYLELKNIAGISNISSIFDFGGGSNNFYDTGHSNLTVIDFAPPKNSSIKFIRTSDFFDADVSESVDCIVSYHTLEHLSNPSKAIEKFYCSLKPGGWLCVEVPDNEIIASTNPTYMVFPQHVSLFTSESLGILIGSRGFELAHDSSFGSVIRMYFRKSDAPKPVQLSTAYKPTYLERYRIALKATVERLTSILDEYPTVQMFAGGSTSCLIYYLKENGCTNISGIRLFDSNSMKHGLRVFTGQVVGPFESLSTEFPLVIIGNSFCERELKSKIGASLRIHRI